MPALAITAPISWHRVTTSTGEGRRGGTVGVIRRESGREARGQQIPTSYPTPAY